MKVKQVINFKMIREKGPAAFDIEGDEVIQLVSSGREIKCIVTQEYLLTLEALKEKSLANLGVELKRTPYNRDEIKEKFHKKVAAVLNLALEDEKEFKTPIIDHKRKANQLLDLLLSDKQEEFNEFLADYLEQVKDIRTKELENKEIKVKSKR